jgi:hypothetical protein
MDNKLFPFQKGLFGIHRIAFLGSSQPRAIELTSLDAERSLLATIFLAQNELGMVAGGCTAVARASWRFAVLRRDLLRTPYLNYSRFKR